MPLATIGLLLAVAAAPRPESYFEVKALAPGVYGVMRSEPAGFAVDCNVTFIVNEKDVVMVDTNIGPESATATLRALKKITSKPVRYVIETHYHDDHIGGNPTVRTAYPGVEFIGSATAARNLDVYGRPTRKQMISAAPTFAASLRDCLKTGKSITGAKLSEEERISYRSDIRLMERYGKELPKIEIIPPTLTVSDHLTLHRRARDIEILSLGSGHTTSDLVVWLPKERIAIVGDLVVWPIPLVGNPQSHVTEWPATLEKIRALKPLTIVPGHGPVIHDNSYLVTLGKLFTSISEQVKAGVDRGEKLKDLYKSIKLKDIKAEMCGNSPVRKVLFDNYAAIPGIQAAYTELTKK
jgi:cyclase